MLITQETLGKEDLVGPHVAGVCADCRVSPPFLNKRGERRSELRLLRLGATLRLRSSITARWLRGEEVTSTPTAWKASVARLKGPVCELQARLPT